MTVDTVSLFLALLAVVAEVSVLAAVVGAVGSRFSASAARTASAAREAVRPNAVPMAAAVATVATAGSLYFSEVAHFTPCRLCWLQRGCMYPLVPLLWLAAWRGVSSIRPVAIALAVIGAIIASYHVVLERHPSLEGDVCDPANPCTLIWIRRLGYLTIPTMALSAFLLIITLLIAARPSRSAASA